MCNEKNIYYVDKDGIYQADKDMGNPHLFLSIPTVSYLSVSRQYIAYSTFDKIGAVIVVLASLETPSIPIQTYNYDYVDYLYLTDSNLYVCGEKENSNGRLYVSNLGRKEQNAFDLSTCVSENQLFQYEDDNISWYYTPSDEENLYIKRDKQILHNSGNWHTRHNFYIPLDNGTLSFKTQDSYWNENVLYSINKKSERRLLIFPTDPLKGAIDFTEFIELPHSKQLYLCQASYHPHETANTFLRDHTGDGVFVLDKDYQLINAYYTQAGERILFADDQQIIWIKETTLYSCDYKSSPKQFAVIPDYSGTLTVQVAGETVLFFHENALHSYVPIPLLK